MKVVTLTVFLIAALASAATIGFSLASYDGTGTAIGIIVGLISLLGLMAVWGME